MSRVQWSIKTPIGKVFLVASAKGLQGLMWDKQSVPMADSLEGSAPEVKMLASAVKQLGEYFIGKRRDFELPIDVQGTEFQKKVWKELSKIPYGTTCSYSDIARRIKNARAVRAVGTANGRNPISIMVPCHRVIAADGTLGGYGGGLKIKTRLLALERPQSRNP